MFLTNGFSATLIQYNRNSIDSPYDDTDTQEVSIKLIPYNADDGIRFGTYTTPEASGCFMVRRELDVKEGDQVTWNNKTYTIQKVADKWIYNRIEYKMVYVK